MKNKKNITKQDIVNIIYDVLKTFKPEDSTTVNLTTKYIISKFKNFEPSDEMYVRGIVYKTFLALQKEGYLKAKKWNEFKATRKPLSEIKLVYEEEKVVKSNSILVEKYDNQQEL